MVSSVNFLASGFKLPTKKQLSFLVPKRNGESGHIEGGKIKNGTSEQEKNYYRTV